MSDSGLMPKAANIVPLRTSAPAAEPRPESGNVFQGIPIERPPKPRWLSKEAGRHWDYISKALEDYGLISKLDLGSLTILCTSYARMKEAEQKIQEEGEFQTTPNGYQQLTPWAVSWERHQKAYLKLANQYGLTLRARQQVKISDPNQTELEL